MSDLDDALTKDDQAPGGEHFQGSASSRGWSAAGCAA